MFILWFKTYSSNERRDGSAENLRDEVKKTKEQVEFTDDCKADRNAWIYVSAAVEGKGKKEIVRTHIEWLINGTVVWAHKNQ